MQGLYAAVKAGGWTARGIEPGHQVHQPGGRIAARVERGWARVAAKLVPRRRTGVVIEERVGRVVQIGAVRPCQSFPGKMGQIINRFQIFVSAT